MTAGPSPQPVRPDLRGSVRLKVGFIVGGAMLLVLGISIFVSTEFLGDIFGNQQDRITRERLERVVICLNKLSEVKMKLTRDNAEWDEAYDFIEGRNPDFLKLNFAPSVNTSGQDIVMVFDASKNLIGAVQTGLDDAYTPPPGLDIPSLAASRLFQEKPEAGLIVAGDRVLMLAACPVNSSDQNNPSNGWLVFGTYLDKERTTEIAELAGARLKIAPLATFPPLENKVHEEQFLMGSLAPVHALYKPAASVENARYGERALLIFPTLSGKDTLGVEVRVSMLVYGLALETKSWIIVIACAVALILLTVGLLTFEISILQPLASLDREMRKISSSASPEILLKARNKNEIGRLAQSFNRLLNRVRAGRLEAEEQKELLSSVLNSASEGVMAFLIKRDLWGEAEDFVFVLVNASAEKMLGRNAEALIGRTLLQEFTAIKRLGIFDRYCRVVKTNRSESFEVYYEADGLKAWFRISANPWKEGLVLTFEDISERKAREAQLQGTLAEIERFNSAMIGREERVIEMKKEVNMLRQSLGQKAIYNSLSDDV